MNTLSIRTPQQVRAFYFIGSVSQSGQATSAVINTHKEVLLH